MAFLALGMVPSASMVVPVPSASIFAEIHENFEPLVQKALDHAVKPLSRYRCAACGFEAKQHFWQCPGCQTWDSYPAKRVEEL